MSLKVTYEMDELIALLESTDVSNFLGEPTSDDKPHEYSPERFMMAVNKQTTYVSGLINGIRAISEHVK